MKLAAPFLIFTAVAAFAQSNPPAQTAAPLPILDPGTEIASWNGRSWNLANNRLFEARFEKYLSTPTDTNQDTTEHFNILSRIRELLAPSNISPQSKQEAFQLLDQASTYHADDLLSDAIGNQVYSTWLAQRNTAQLQAATATLQKEKKQLEWNMRVVAGEDHSSDAPPPQGGFGDGKPAQPTAPQFKPNLPSSPNSRQALELQQINARLAEVNLLLRSNELKRETSLAQAKTDFQILIVQLFLQRRFVHVLIAARFYRSLFADGSSQQLKLGADAQSFFTQTTGNPPTLTSLEAICGEMIGNAYEGVNAFKALLAEKEMASATKRLSEAFLIGEYLTSLDVVSTPEKHQALVFIHKSNQLTHALEVKDYTLAEKLVNDLQATAKDFDTTPANAAIQNARILTAMHLARARNAAASDDRETQERELNAATELWPTNPALAEVARGIYSQANVHARAMADFNQLVSQRSWRQIYNERMRFIPAVAADPEKQAKLQEVMDNIIVLDRAQARAEELEKRGEPAAAWEIAELMFRQFPEEYPRLMKYRSELMVQAADYVNAIHTAEKLEAQGDLGSSLHWYLQAQIQYPDGELAKAGIQRVNHLILPDSW